jgi:hypothetical protein
MVEQLEIGEEIVKIENCLAKQLYLEEGKGIGLTILECSG